jgi:hypothetical protein
MNAENLMTAIGVSSEELLQRSEGRGSASMRWKRWVPLAAGFFVVMAVAFTLKAFGVGLPIPWTRPPTTPWPTVALTADIRVNELSSGPDLSSFGILLRTEDFVPMTDKQYMAYFRVTLPSEISPGLVLQRQRPDSINGIFRSDARGVYFDGHGFLYARSNENQGITVSKEIMVMIAKGRMPFGFADTEAAMMQNSVVGGIDMLVAHYRGPFLATRDSWFSDIRYAEFQQDGNAYIVLGKNLDEEAFVDLLKRMVSAADSMD